MKSLLRRVFHRLLKTAIAAGVAFGVGWLIVAGADDEAMPEASADIVWLDAVPDSKYAKFVDTLEQYDFNPPQSYHWNGNDVFVAFKQTRQRPQDVLYELQTRFYEAGINRDVYAAPPDPRDLGNPEAGAADKMLAALGANDFVGGAMIPVSNTAEHTAMVGIDTHDQAANLAQFVAEANRVGSDLDRLISATRYVEAFRDQASGTTTVLAVWSGQGLRFSRMGGQTAEVRGDADIPACPRCTLSSNIDGQGDDRSYAITTYNSPLSARSVLSFYDRALVSRGWSSDPASVAVVQTHPELRAAHNARVYTRKGEALTVQAYRPSGARQTRVNLFRGR